MPNPPRTAPLTWSMLAVLGLCAPSLAAHAADAEAIPAQPVSELWLDPGFYAYHFQRDRHLNDNAAGIGAEYRFSSSSAVAAGSYHNSNWGRAHYVAYYWRPVAVGPVRFGVVAGVVNGYPGTRKGGWFPAALPTLSVEHGRIGLNVFYVPSYKDSINGSITFQLNFRLF